MAFTQTPTALCASAGASFVAYWSQYCNEHSWPTCMVSILVVTVALNSARILLCGKYCGTTHPDHFHRFALSIQDDDGSIVFLPNKSVLGVETVNLSVCETRVLSVSVPFRVPSGGIAFCKELLVSLKERLREHATIKPVLAQVSSTPPALLCRCFAT